MNWQVNEQGVRCRDMEIEALRDSIAEMATLNGVAVYHTNWLNRDDGSFRLILTIPHVAGETETDLAKAAAHIIAMNLTYAINKALDKPAKLSALVEATTNAQDALAEAIGVAGIMIRGDDFISPESWSGFDSAMRMAQLRLNEALAAFEGRDEE